MNLIVMDEFGVERGRGEGKEYSQIIEVYPIHHSLGAQCDYCCRAGLY